MKLQDLLAGVNIRKNSADVSTEISGIIYDSRKVTPDVLFAALSGTGTDGHKFIESARKSGASCVLIEDEQFYGSNCILVEDSRRALAQIASNYYGNPSAKLKIIGVTGTNGKTTTTLILKQVLEKLGAKSGLIGTLQNMVGDRVIETRHTTPEPVELHRLFAEMVAEGCEYAVMEVSSHSLVQHRVAGLHFELGVFTNLTQDHLDFHKTMEEYLAAKLKLFRMCGKGIINRDDAACDIIKREASCNCFTYSAYQNDADVVAKNIHYRATSVEYEVVTTGHIGRAKVEIPGKFTVYNSLAVITAALCLGYELKDVLAVLSEVKGVKGRVEVVNTGLDYTVLIDYAHTPDALLNVLNAVHGSATGRVVTLFGCGGNRDKTKRPQMGSIASELSDFCIVTSDNPRNEEPMEIIADILEGMQGKNTPYIVIENRHDAIEYALRNAHKDDIILLAGKGHETYQILGDNKTIHFDEREIIAEILCKIGAQKT